MATTPILTFSKKMFLQHLSSNLTTQGPKHQLLENFKNAFTLFDRTWP